VSYSVEILLRAVKQLEKLPPEVYPRIRESLVALANEPRPAGCLKLRGREGWRLRVGDYRIIYEIDDETRRVVILDIGHRREIYRR
jgi:mRNA interferase RelE/StbE